MAFHGQQIPPTGGLSTLTTSDPVTRGNVAQIPATTVHPMDCSGALWLNYLTQDGMWQCTIPAFTAQQAQLKRCTAKNGLTGKSRVVGTIWQFGNKIGTIKTLQLETSVNKGLKTCDGVDFSIQLYKFAICIKPNYFKKQRSSSSLRHTGQKWQWSTQKASSMS